MKLMLQIIILIILLLVAASGYALWANKLPWKEPPGYLTRLSIYLSRNVAETSDQAILPELRTKTLPVEAGQFLDEVTKHVIALGWQLQSVDADKLELTATATTRWLNFTDDIIIRLEPLSERETRVHIRSTSRIGRADYGANLGRILRLYWSLGI